MQIQSKDISVIVQGAIDKVNTPKCLRSIRKHLPQAEIILSTWKGSDLSGLDYDVLVENDDPGECELVRKFPQEQNNNINRQLVSSLNGLKHANRRYAMKLRSDMFLTGCGFIKIYEKFSKPLDNTYFNQRIMVNGLTTSINLTFAIGDWWAFGLKKDLFSLYNIPLYPRKKGEEYFLQNENISKKPFLADIVCQYSPEQYIFYAFISKYKKVNFQHFFDNTPENLEFSKDFILKNLICIESHLSNVVLKKQIINANAFKYNLYFLKWYKLLNEYVHEFHMLTKYEIWKLKAFTKFNMLLAKLFGFPYEYINIIRNYYRAHKIKKTYINSNISKKDITFVVTGKLDYNGKYNAYQSLKSIRKYFPESTIILTTWKDANLLPLKGLYDEVVINDRKDIPYSNYNAQLPSSPVLKLNTYNMQQHMVSNALKKVKTKYVIKYRPDLILKNDNMFKLYKKYLKIYDSVDDKYFLFKNKVLIPNFLVRDSRIINFDFPYQISDIVNFGLKEDIEKLWDGNIMPKNISNYFAEHPNSSYFNPCLFNHLYTIEQYFLFNVLEKQHIPYSKPKWYLDKSSDMFTFESEKIIASNFIVFPFSDLGIKCKFNKMKIPGLLTFFRFNELYLQYVDPHNSKVLKILKKQELQCLKKEKIFKTKQKLKKHIKNFLFPFQVIENSIKKFLVALLSGIKRYIVRPLCYFFKWITEPFSILFYLFKLVMRFMKIF